MPLARVRLAWARISNNGVAICVVFVRNLLNSPSSSSASVSISLILSRSHTLRFILRCVSLYSLVFIRYFFLPLLFVRLHPFVFVLVYESIESIILSEMALSMSASSLSLSHTLSTILSLIFFFFYPLFSSFLFCLYVYLFSPFLLYYCPFFPFVSFSTSLFASFFHLLHTCLSFKLCLSLCSSFSALSHPPSCFPSLLSNSCSLSLLVRFVIPFRSSFFFFSSSFFSFSLFSSIFLLLSSGSLPACQVCCCV